MGQGLGSCNGVCLVHVSVFGQRGCGDLGDVPGVCNADRHFSDGRLQDALCDDRGERNVSLQDQVGAHERPTHA
jgi:hypothetical protein